MSIVKQTRCSFCSKPLRPDGTCPSCDRKASSRWLNLGAGVLIAIGLALAFATIAILVLLAAMTRRV